MVWYSGQLETFLCVGVWAWFIFSEVMFFAAFFGALFYVRYFVMSWLGGDGGKALTGDYLWPEFDNTWPVIANPDNALFAGPKESMAPPPLSEWGGYLPFWNTAILLTSSITVHFAHTGLKNDNRKSFISWLALTVVLGVIFSGAASRRIHRSLCASRADT